jgi:hypothetical protein
MTFPNSLHGRRLVALPSDAIDDLDEGYLHVLTNFDEGWSVGLLSDTHGNAEDYALASMLRDRGVPVLLLWDVHLVSLTRGRFIELRDPAGNRYLIKAFDVDSVEQLDEDDEG